MLLQKRYKNEGKSQKTMRQYEACGNSSEHAVNTGETHKERKRYTT